VFALHTAGKTSFGQRRSGSGSRPNGANGDIGNASGIVADPSLPRLPPKYVGDNAALLYQRLVALGARLRKSQFETTSDYFVRVDGLLKKVKISETRTALDRLSFVSPYAEESYDADGQIFTVSPDPNYEAGFEYFPGVSKGVPMGSNYKSLDLVRSNRNVGSRVGRTAIGIRKRIAVTTHTELRLAMLTRDMDPWSSKIVFRVPPAAAREASGKVWLAVTGHLAYPYALQHNGVDTATLDDPIEEHDFTFYLTFVPDSVVVFNGFSGQIYTSWTSPSAPVARVPVTGSAVTTEDKLENGVRILSKPEPQYTEEARQKLIQGTVVLSALFGANGEVSGIQVVRPLSYGLTESAIEAAKQIKFVPAEINGKRTSVRMNVEYEFRMF
jgi:TonB family protein